VKNHGRNGDGPESDGTPRGKTRKAVVVAQRAVAADQSAADADQTTADADQTSSDADQTASGTDQTSANRDQLASDHDQATADRDRASHPGLTAADKSAYDVSRGERETTTVARHGRGLERAATARGRDATADQRDTIADARDGAGRARDTRTTEAARAASKADAPLLKQLEELGAQAAADRDRAATDRARAARDRVKAAKERARLEAELRSAYLDDLTGAYHRQMGRLTLSHEIDRARRSDGRFVLAFVDVDGLKDVNDRDGHAAGDRVLQTVVNAMRTRLRSFDPIIRFGGDEFVCGLIGTDRSEVKRRFDAIGAAIRAEANVGISVGLATLAPGDTADRLIERADATMLHVKAKHHSRSEPEPTT
jgi:diguanylate cyclase (GGDEF)-like protein